MNAKAKRKRRRVESRQNAQEARSGVLGDNVTIDTISTVERLKLTNPCPRCGMIELRRLAGTERMICYRCDRGK